MDAVQKKHSEKLGLISNPALRRGAAPVRPALAVGRLSTPSVKLAKEQVDAEAVEKRSLPQNVAVIPRHHSPPAWHPLHRLVLNTATREKHRVHFSQHLFLPSSPERPCTTSIAHRSAVSTSTCTGSTHAYFLSREYSSTFEPKHSQAPHLCHNKAGLPATSCAHVPSANDNGSCFQGRWKPSTYAQPLSSSAVVAATLVPKRIECKSEDVGFAEREIYKAVNVQLAHATTCVDRTDTTMDSSNTAQGAKKVDRYMASPPGCNSQTCTSTSDNERPQRFNIASEACDPAPGVSSLDENLDEDSNSSVDRPLGTFGPPLQCVPLPSSACKEHCQDDANCAELCKGDAYDDSSTFTDSMTSSGDESCTCPDIDWSEPMDASGLKEIEPAVAVDDSLTISVQQQTSLPATPALASHPLSLTNQSSVSPEVYYPHPVGIVSPDSRPNCEQARSSLESGMDVTCMEMVDDDIVGSDNGCSSLQPSPCAPDVNDRLVAGKRILGNQYVVEKVVGEVCKDEPILQLVLTCK